MKILFSFALLAVGAAVVTGPAHAASKVVASIKPVHSLVAAVMAGAGVPDLIIEGAKTPHASVLTPSQAVKLDQADIIFWIGPGLEGFLEKPIAMLGHGARAAPLMDVKNLTLLKKRRRGDFGSDSTHREDHGHVDVDPHVWLDPDNAKAMVAHIAGVLAATDPENSKVYAANAADLGQKLDKLKAEIADQLAPVAGMPFFVSHDAYGYFESRFGMKAEGSISLRPDTPPGAAHMSRIRESIKTVGATCVFSEPQFGARLNAVAIEGTKASVAFIDPLGADIPAGPGHYFTQMRNLAASMVKCLGSLH